ncbi:hypothetical protein V1509DRAFT_42845 [Lipomyces kononenkoae]
MFLHMPIFQTITNLLADTTRATVVDDEVAGDVDEPPERGLRQLHIQDEQQFDSFKRQLCISPPRNQSSLLSKMLTSPISAASDAGSSTGADPLSDSGYTSRNTTPTPPPVSLHLPPPAYPQTKGIMRFANPTANSTNNNTQVAADVDKKQGECAIANGLKRSIKFACTGGKECSRDSSSSAGVSEAGREKRVALASRDDHEVHHPQPQRILRVDDLLLKEREISRLNAEVEAEDNDENEDDDDEVGDRPSLDATREQSLGDEERDMQDDDDDDDDDENNGSDDDDDDLSPDASSSPVLAPGSVRGNMLARVHGSPCVEYDSEDEEEEFHSNVEDGYASDDDDDGMSEYNGPAANLPHGELKDRISRHKSMYMVQRTATPPANLIPDSSDFVCGTFDEDRPIEVAYYSAIEEHARYNHKPCPQDIDPSFPEDDGEDSEDAKSDNDSEGSRRLCRSPPPVHHNTRHHPNNVPVPNQKQRQNRCEYEGKATSFQHNRPLLRYRLHSNNNNGKSTNRERGAIDIVKGLERKNNRRRERRHQHQHQHQHPHHDIIPGEGVEKMRQLGLFAVKKGENPYAEWMLSV